MVSEEIKDFKSPNKFQYQINWQVHPAGHVANSTSSRNNRTQAGPYVLNQTLNVLKPRSPSFQPCEKEKYIPENVARLQSKRCYKKKLVMRISRAFL